jgi:hypothetical protein
MNEPYVEMLSDAVRTLLAEDGRYAKLVVDAEPDDAELRQRIAAVGPAELLRKPVVSQAAARAMLAGIWLWHDFLDESHTISQGLGDATGSYWHAIMHRREGDFSNSKYWYARCRNHPVIGQLGYDPDDFVDDVARASRQGTGEALDAAVEMQRREWEALFTYCVRAATASASATTR